jgi:chemotaxis-related protein WspB
MLLLLFKIGDEHYAMDAGLIKEIVPMVTIKKIASAPDFVAGLINYRGSPLPVIDLCALSTGTPCEIKLSTRIVLIKYFLQDRGKVVLGLIAEHVVETVRTKLSKPPVSGVVLDDLLHDTESPGRRAEMIQWFNPQQMLPAQTVYELFSE